jgi:hypothetical protein
MDIRIGLTIFVGLLSFSAFCVYCKLYFDYVIKRPLESLVKIRLLTNAVATLGCLLIFVAWSIWQPIIWELAGPLFLISLFWGFLVMPGINQEIVFLMFPRLKKRK